MTRQECRQFKEDQLRIIRECASRWRSGTFVSWNDTAANIEFRCGTCGKKREYGEIHCGFVTEAATDR